MVLGESIDSKIIGNGPVSASDFRQILDEIKLTLRHDRMPMEAIYKLVALDTEGEEPDRKTIENYYTGNAEVPRNIYNGAISTLRWAYRNAEIDPGIVNARKIPRVRRTRKGIMGVEIHANAEGKAAEAKESTASSEDAPRIAGATTTQESHKQDETTGKEKRTIPAKRGPKHDKNEAVYPHEHLQTPGTVSYMKAREIMLEIVGGKLCRNVEELDREMAKSGLTERGSVKEAFKNQEGFTTEMYESIKAFARKDKRYSGKHKDIPPGHVPYFALEEMLEALGCTDRKDVLKTDRKISSRGHCEKGELSRAYRQKTYCPQETYIGLVKLVVEAEGTGHNSITDKIATPVMYETGGTYCIGQILELPNKLGVVIAKPERNRILVALDEKHPLPDDEDKQESAPAEDDDEEKESAEDAYTKKPNQHIYVEKTPENPFFQRKTSIFDKE